MMNPSQLITTKRFIIIAALSAMIAVILGAFAAHALKAQLSSEHISIFQTGVFYQLIHSIALLCIALSLLHFKTRLISLAGWLFFLGILLFSGSLYLISLLGIKTLGMITPCGGICFILGWLLFAIGVYKKAPE